MKNWLLTIENYKEVIVFIAIPLLALLIPFWQYLHSKKREQELINFEKFHEKIMGKLSNQKRNAGVEEQVAIIFDLRNFPKYFSVSKRILKDFIGDINKQIKNEKDNAKNFGPRLIKEAEESLKYMNHNFIIRFFIDVKDKYIK